MSSVMLSSAPVLRAHQEWATRPPDQRFTSLDALKRAVTARASLSTTVDVSPETLRFTNDAVVLHTPHGTAEPTHWAFGQLAGQLGVPSGYVRSLPPSLAAACLSHGLSTHPQESWRLLLTADASDSDASPMLRAITSPMYGRIWDRDVVTFVEQLVNQTGGQFFNPKDGSGIPSGLYASDRDVFLFFIDGDSVVEGGGDRDQLHRGFFVWNSEVGAASFGISVFLFRAMCSNHIVWGVTDYREVRIRHSSRAPERFLTEAAPLLTRCMTASAQPIEAHIQRAKRLELPLALDERLTWLEARGLTRPEARAAIDRADEEEGQSITLWDLVNGVSAVARTLPHLDTKVALERKAGALLALAS